jgi:hypothetical protein
MACVFLDLDDLVLYKLLVMLFTLLTQDEITPGNTKRRIGDPRACLNATCKRLYKLMPHARIREMLTTQICEIRAKFFEHVVETGMHVLNHSMDVDGDGDSWAMTFWLRMDTMDICVYTMFRNRDWSDYFVNFYVHGERDDQPTCHDLKLFGVPEVIYVPLADRTPQQIKEIAQWTEQNKEAFVKHLLNTFKTIEFTSERRFGTIFDRTEFTRASRARYLLLRV